jgi:hypothetical protein
MRRMIASGELERLRREITETHARRSWQVDNRR